MNTIFKHRILTGAMLLGATLLGASCEDSEGLKVTPETPYADKTLYEVVKADADLTDFMEIVDLCGAECADSLFNQSRVYTLWAPENNSFNKDSIAAEIEAGNRDVVFRTFVMAHISNHLKPANGKLDEDNKILLLNEKVAVFEGNYTSGYFFGGRKLTECNIRAWNGILHKIENPSEYKYSIWEYLKLDSRIDSVANYLYSFNVVDFNPGQSILGPIKDGAQTYLDSVFTTTNVMLNPWSGVGAIDKEDSLYVVYVPTNEVWAEMVKKADKHFNYNRTAYNPVSMDSLYRDSLRNHYSHFNVVKYISFSEYEQKHVNNPDSVMPAYRSGERPEFLRAQLEQNVIFTKELSNGVLKIVDKSPFTQFDLWHDTIKVEVEDDIMRFYASAQNNSIKTVTKTQLKNDSIFAGCAISGSRYFESESPKAAATVRVKVPKLLSASYNVAFIVVPKNILTKVDESELLQSKFTVAVYQGTKRLYQVTNVYNDPTRIDTVFLKNNKGERLVVDIPYCEFYNSYSEKDFDTYIEIKTNRGNDLDTSLRLDAVIFEPVEDSEE